MECLSLMFETQSLEVNWADFLDDSLNSAWFDLKLEIKFDGRVHYSDAISHSPFPIYFNPSYWDYASRTRLLIFDPSSIFVC